MVCFSLFVVLFPYQNILKRDAMKEFSLTRGMSSLGRESVSSGEIILILMHFECSPPKSVDEIFVFDMCSFIYFIIHLLIKIFVIIHLQCGRLKPSQKGPWVLWKVTSPEPVWHCCS